MPIAGFLSRPVRAMAFTVFAVGCAVAAGDDPTERLLGAALDQPRGYDKLAWLTDRIGPRLSGSPGFDAAAKWAAEEFRKDGMDRVWTEKVMVPCWRRGLEVSEIVSPVHAPMATTALGMSPPTPEGGIAAAVLEVRSLDELKAAGDAVKGKIALFNKPMLVNGGEENGYGAAAALRHHGGVEAAKLGAVGAMIRSLGTAAFRLPHTGMTEFETAEPRIPFAAISQEDADRIHRLLAAGETVRVRMELTCKTLPDVEQSNVLAEIRGREHPEQIVLIGAHLDSWDLATGAIDDGAGCAIVMETMRLIKALGIQPRRTIRAVLYVNEENGLRGGKAYAEAHASELENHVAAVESDSGGARPIGFGLSSGSGGEEILRRIAAPLGSVAASQVTDGGGGADISPLRKARVPMIGLRQDTTHYFDYHHSAADTLDKVDPKDLALNVAALAVVAYGLADSVETLPRPEPSKTSR